MNFDIFFDFFKEISNFVGWMLDVDDKMDVDDNFFSFFSPVLGLLRNT